MPSHRLAEEAVSAPALAIFGTYASGSSQIVSHVGIIAEGSVLESGKQIPVRFFDMGPPLRLGSATPDPPPIAHVVGWLSLSVDEREGVADWIAALRTRFAARMPPRGRTEPLAAFLSRTHYSVCPAYQRARIDKITNREIHEYFSCVGFVLACYQEGAGIRILVDPEVEPVPLAGLPTITKVYGMKQASIVRRYQSELNVADGPWPILFGGYIFHALDGSQNLLPHHPRFIEMKY